MKERPRGEAAGRIYAWGKVVMRSFTVERNQAGQRLDKFLHKYLPQAGSGFLYKMLRKKNITLNGKKADGHEILSLGDEVKLFFSDETFAKFSGVIPGGFEGRGHDASPAAEYRRAYGRLGEIPVLYEDADCLILNKPAGVLTQKAAAKDDSLNEWLIGYLLERHSLSEAELSTFRPSVCNRLDRNTSGVVLCGKSLAGLQYLSKCIKERRVRKFYRAVCVGELTESAAIDGYLVKDTARNRVTVASGHIPGDGASPVYTLYSPLAVCGNYTLLELELITGKTHQIRAHLAGIGHPLVGDFKYGLESVNRRFKREYGLEHQLLHACRVEFSEVASNPETAFDLETAPGYESVSGPGAALSGRSISAPCPELFRKIQAELFFIL